MVSAVLLLSTPQMAGPSRALVKSLGVTGNTGTREGVGVLAVAYGQCPVCG